jgi:hypothetical protein
MSLKAITAYFKFLYQNWSMASQSVIKILEEEKQAFKTSYKTENSRIIRWSDITPVLCFCEY